jgi:putative DNA primase/helicase
MDTDVSAIRGEINPTIAGSDPRTWPADAWPKPLPLPDGMPAVASFDYAMLPDRLCPWVHDVSERMQCPPDFVAIPMIAAAGNLIGRRCAIRPKANDSWTEFPNLWACIVGRSGEMKSPSMSSALAPIKRLEARAQAKYDAEQEEWKIDSEVSKARADAVKAEAIKDLKKNPRALVDRFAFAPPEADEAPTLRRYTATSATVEALGERLIENPRGLLIVRDELPPLLNILSREENAELRGFFMSGWNASEGWSFDRIGRGHRRVPSVCLGIVGGAQPGPLLDYLRASMRGGASDDGMLARFGLLVWPETGGKWRNVDRAEDGSAKELAFSVFDELDVLDAMDRGAEREADDAPPFLHFAPDAQEVFKEWHEGLEKMVRSRDLLPVLESHLSKYRKIVPALALIFHLVDGHSGPVGLASTLRALHWSVYLETHARRCYGVAQDGEADTARRILDRIEKGDLPRDGFGSREIQRSGWSGLNNQKHVAAGLDLLVELGHMEVWQETTRTKPRTLYVHNPKSTACVQASCAV